MSTQQKYDERFRRNAVQLVESGQTAAQVARDLGVPASQLYAWCKTYRTAPSSHGNAVVNQDEAGRLRRELAAARAELDILKKAIGIFGRSGAGPRR
jgi:transposase